MYITLTDYHYFILLILEWKIGMKWEENESREWGENIRRINERI